MRRWLVTLALAVVALPNVADARGFRVELTNRTVTSTTKNLPGRQCPARVTKLPSSVELDVGAINITTPTHIVRHSLGQPDGLSWVVGVACDRARADARSLHRRRFDRHR